MKFHNQRMLMSTASSSLFMQGQSPDVHICLGALSFAQARSLAQCNRHLNAHRVQNQYTPSVDLWTLYITMQAHSRGLRMGANSQQVSG